MGATINEGTSQAHRQWGQGAGGMGHGAWGMGQGARVPQLFTGNVLQLLYIVDFIPYTTGFYILMPLNLIKPSTGLLRTLVLL